MTVNVSVKYSKNHLYPRTLAEANPTFDWAPWETAEPIYLSPTDVALVNGPEEEKMLETIQSTEILTEEEKMDFFYDYINQLESSLTWTDEGYTATFAFDNKYLEFIEFLSSSPSDSVVTITTV